MAKTDTACETYTWNGKVYIVSGDYTYKHLDGNGCTQVDTLHLTVHHPVHVAKTDTACETCTWNGKAYTVSGDYTYKHLDANGCTQVDTLHLTIHNPVRPTSTNHMVKTLRFTKCRFYGGYNNIHMCYAGTSNTVFGSVMVDSCELLNAYYNGYYSPNAGHYILTARDNYIHNAPNASTYTAFRFGSMTSYLDLDTLVRNRIWCNATSTNYGVYVGQTVNYYGPLAGKDAIIHNNEFLITGTAGTSYGFYYGNMSYMDWRHNTFYMNTTGARYGIYNTNTGNYRFNFYDNLVYMAGSSGTAECIFSTSWPPPIHVYGQQRLLQRAAADHRSRREQHKGLAHDGEQRLQLQV